MVLGDLSVATNDPWIWTNRVITWREAVFHSVFGALILTCILYTSPMFNAPLSLADFTDHLCWTLLLGNDIPLQQVALSHGNANCSNVWEMDLCFTGLRPERCLKSSSLMIHVKVACNSVNFINYRFTDFLYVCVCFFNEYRVKQIIWINK